MKNIVTYSIPALMNSADLMIGGLRDLKTELDLRYADPEVVKERLAALVQARGNYEQAKFTLSDLQATMTSLTDRARATAMIARDVLKPFLGNQHSQLWEGTGYVFSLETPRSFQALLNLLRRMALYLGSNPGQENAPLNITSAKVTELVSEMIAVQQALASQTADLGILLDERNEKVTTLRSCLRDVIDELHLRLKPLDRRWLRFGLNMPGAKETPDAPTNVKVKVVEETTAMIEFPKSPRAEYYRVYQRIIGVDTEPKPIGSPMDPNFTIEDLQRGVTVEISVSAVNDGGESALSEPVTVKIE